MPCCNKKRQDDIKKHSDIRKNIIKKIDIKYKKKELKIELLTDQQLITYHNNLHKIYNQKSSNITNQNYIKSLIELHNNILTEMFKRNIEHDTPLV